jgi:hypothetical protein
VVPENATAGTVSIPIRDAFAGLMLVLLEAWRTLWPDCRATHTFSISPTVMGMRPNRVAQPFARIRPLTDRLGLIPPQCVRQEVGSGQQPAGLHSGVIVGMAVEPPSSPHTDEAWPGYPGRVSTEMPKSDTDQTITTSTS